jgi:preprotein translocase subunit SecG
LQGILLTVHIIVCILLIIVVLLQSGKDADLAGAFGGYGSQSTFGPRGTATLLSKITTTLAILFMLISFTIYLYTRSKYEDQSAIVSSQVQVTVRDSDTRAPVPEAKVILGYVIPESLEDRQATSEAYTNRLGVAEVKLYHEGMSTFSSVRIVETGGYRDFEQRDVPFAEELEFLIEKQEEPAESPSGDEDTGSPDQRP